MTDGTESRMLREVMARNMAAAKTKRPEPDCRTCVHFDCISLGCHADRCDGVNMYQPLPPAQHSETRHERHR